MDVALLLLQDGLTNGAVYALVALALVLVFVVSRVILVQGGEFVSYAALTLGMIQAGHVPALLWVSAAACTAIGLWDVAHAPSRRAALRAALQWVGPPALICPAALLLVGRHPPLPVQLALALAIVTPIGPAMYRLAYARIARHSTLALLITSIAVQFVLGGIGLMAFGPEGSRTVAFSDAMFEVGPVLVTAQSLWIYGLTATLILALFAVFRHTLFGVMLRAAADNPRGAVLMGIRPDVAGQLSFGLAAFLCAMAGLVISPVVTIYYDTGFSLGLKAFIGAVMGGFVSYPLAAGGALAIGVFEAFAAFASSTYKEALVFLPLVPILLLRSILSHSGPDEEEQFGGEPAGWAEGWSLRSRLLGLPLGLWAAMAVVAALALPYLLGAAQLLVADEVLLATITVLGVTLLTGIAGQVSFGQAAFVGVGAYGAAIAAGSCDRLQSVLGAFGLQPGDGACHLSPWASLPFALTAAALIAIVLGAITLRMRSHFLPIATIAWALSAYYLFGSTPLLGGFSGLTDLHPLPVAWPPGLPYEGRLYYPILVAALACAGAMMALLDSRTGRAIRALRSRTMLAESCGVATATLKLKVFVLAALVAGLSGWFYAGLQRFVSPSPFSMLSGAEYLFMSVVGGSGQIAGALLGSATVRLLREGLQDVFAWTSFGQAGEAEHILFGVVIVVILQFSNGGMAALLSRLPGRPPHDAPPLPPGSDEMAGAGGAPSPPAVLLDVQGLGKRFGGLVALRDVSFQVHTAEIVALIGPNGAGKSTLFNAVTGFARPTSGTVRICGQDIATLSPHRIAALQVRRTFQHVKLLPDRTVLENVALGAYHRTRSGLVSGMLRLDRSEERATLARAHQLLARLGLEGVATRRAGHLALGQQRLVEIARALAADPALLMLDEPAAGLRYAEKQALSGVLRRLRQDGMGILLVEHDMGFVMDLADKVVVVCFGQKIAEGPALAIQSDPVVREAYLGA